MGIALASDSTIATANAPYLRTSAHDGWRLLQAV